MAAAESALVVLVPEAEALVKPFRDQHDPSAAAGVPAHITLLYPFLPPEDIGADHLGRLCRLFAGCQSFAFSLAALRRFESPMAVLYLAPEPADGLRQLTEHIWRLYPQHPPYGGKFDGIAPHLTVAQAADSRGLDEIATRFAVVSAQRLPIASSVNEAVLIDNRSGRWDIRAVFPLGRG